MSRKPCLCGLFEWVQGVPAAAPLLLSRATIRDKASATLPPPPPPPPPLLLKTLVAVGWATGHTPAFTENMVPADLCFFSSLDQMNPAVGELSLYDVAGTPVLPLM